MFDRCVKVAKVLWSVLPWCIERKTKWTFPFVTISWKFWQYNEQCLFNNIGLVKIGPHGWQMTILRKLTTMNIIKWMKKGICDGYCKVSSVKFVLGYINHNLINNVIFHT
jgi:hypothetical protein